MHLKDKRQLAQQIGKILTQNGAVCYGVAKDILQLCDKMLENSAVIEPLTECCTTTVKNVTRSPIGTVGYITSPPAAFYTYNMIRHVHLIDI